MKINLNPQNKAFGINISPTAYDNDYLANPKYNGSEPDQFVVSRLGQYPKSAVVLDVGAGQGRNSIPLAKKGFNVLSMEISPAGRDCIKKRALNNKVSEKVTTLDQGILDDFSLEKKADFAFMSKISQHLNLDELKKSLQELYKNTKEGGEIVFDALCCEEENKGIPLNHEELERNGKAWFFQKDIEKITKEIGFRQISTKPFNEKLAGRPLYESFWRKLAEQKLSLRWFVLKK